MRGTFANIRLRNRLVEGKEGPYTVHLPDGEEGFIYDVAMRYGAEGVPLAIIAGREYGSGSSRDWAAKGPALLGVRFALAESFERIHRSNLVGMGILPLQFQPGESAAVARPDRARDLLGDGAGRRPDRPARPWRSPRSATRPRAVTAASAGSMPSPGSTARSRSSTTSPAGSCRRSCAASQRRTEGASGNEEAPGGGTGGFCAEERASLSLGRVIPEDVTRVATVF